jgi:hypothetical protein
MFDGVYRILIAIDKSLCFRVTLSASREGPGLCQNSTLTSAFSLEALQWVHGEKFIGVLRTRLHRQDSLCR